MLKRSYVLLILMSLVLTFFVSCEEAEETDPCNPVDVAGELEEVAFRFLFTPEQVEQQLSMFGAPIGITLTHTVDTYRITYKTRDKDGDLVSASGLMAVPPGVDTLDVISVQHGTVVQRDRVGSVNPVFSMDALLFAMNGYLALAPDYLGLGQSETIHPYLHAELTANAVVDLIRAARAYACQNDLVFNDDIFLAGYSEGGYATLASQREIETHYADEIQLKAVVPMSGPYDLLGSTRNLLSRESYAVPAFFGYVVVAYNDVYGWDRLGDIFQDPYADQLPGLFDGTLDIGTINADLPTRIDEFFEAGFVEGIMNGSETEILAALEENTLLDWSPVAPILLTHGTADSTVSYANSETTLAALSANGAEISLLPIQGADHIGGFFPSVLLAKAWFDELR